MRKSCWDFSSYSLPLSLSQLMPIGPDQRRASSLKQFSQVTFAFSSHRLVGLRESKVRPFVATKLHFDSNLGEEDRTGLVTEATRGSLRQLSLSSFRKNLVRAASLRTRLPACECPLDRLAYRFQRFFDVAGLHYGRPYLDPRALAGPRASSPRQLPARNKRHLQKAPFL